MRVDALMDEINASTSEEDNAFEHEMSAIDQVALGGNMQPRDEFLSRYERAGKEARTKRMLDGPHSSTLIESSVLKFLTSALIHSYTKQSNHT